MLHSCIACLGGVLQVLSCANLTWKNKLTIAAAFPSTCGLSLLPALSMGNWLMCMYIQMYVNNPPTPTGLFSPACSSPETFLLLLLLLDTYLPFLSTSVLSSKFLLMFLNKLTVGLFNGYELTSLSCSAELGFVICSFNTRWLFPRASEGL